MSFVINKTPVGTEKYPMHSHGNYEIMQYVEGEGEMRTSHGNIPFSKGTVIIIPPSVSHGSVSDRAFLNISIEGDFDRFFGFDSPVVIQDNETREGETLAKLIYENRYGNEAYVESLCDSYAHYLLQRQSWEGSMKLAMKRLLEKISRNAFDCNIDVSRLLREAGYAEDYARKCFKRETGRTPTEFLTDVRMKHARYLIDVYRDTLSLTEIAEKCGYLDYVYFSKKFKETVGTSPREYKNSRPYHEKQGGEECQDT